MSLQDYLGRYLPALNQELHEAVDRFLPGPSDFDRMLRYHLGWVDAQGSPTEGYSGKQIRPGIVLLCAEGAGGDWRQALPAAAAVELIHNFSLIHDDIEDDSPLRRGRATVWKVWGKSSALNAGDAMFALAHLVLWTLVERGVPEDRVLAAWRLFEETSLALTRGQHLDMAFESRAQISVDEYLEMIEAKSASLIAAAARVGALVAGVEEGRLAGFESFGRNLGLGFQIRDDILGIWGDPTVTGKSSATDIVSRKKSLPVLYGLGVSAELRSIYRRSSFGADDVVYIVGLLDSVGARRYVSECAARYFGEALAALEGLGVVHGVFSGLAGLLRVLVGEEF